MSHSYNKKHNKKRAFRNKIAKTFDSFCHKKNIDNYNMLPEKEYNELLSQWESYKNFYKIKEVNK